MSLLNCSAISNYPDHLSLRPDRKPKRIPLTKQVALLVTLVVTWTSSSLACPRIGGLIDYNCDQKHVITITGDSLVYGRGDLAFGSHGGYAQRLKPIFPESRINKLGFPGITTARLLTFYKKLFVTQPKSKIIKQLGAADILIFDIGRNDFFNKDPAALTVTTLKRLMTYIAAELKKRFKSTPLMVAAYLVPTTRGFQRPFVDEVNAILSKTKSDAFPVYLRFDLLDPMYISIDGVHPYAGGYAKLTEIAEEYIKDEAQERSKAGRTDLDKDEIYDQFEKLRFKTNPNKTDTDGDGLNDGEEVFSLKTDPLKLDTDGDGFNDGQEILNGTDPLTPDLPVTPSPETPTPTATPVVSPTPTATPTP